MTTRPLVDAAGQEHEAVGARARIVSPVPSLTELLFELGLGAQVVGRTRYCIHPAAPVRCVPIVGGTKTIRIDDILRLQPSHVLVNIEETPKSVAETVASLGIDVVVTHPVQVDDNADVYHLFGALFDRPAKAAVLSERLQAARARIDAAARHWSDRQVLYLIWKKPWMTVAINTYVSHMLRLARMHTIEMDGTEAVRYPAIDMNDALLDRVDLVLFASEPFPFGIHYIAAFRQAFPTHRDKARLIDGEMLSWYGARAIDGINYLADFAERVAAASAG